LQCRSCGGIYCDACNPVGAAQITSGSLAPTEDAGDGSFYVGKYVGRKDPRRPSEAAACAETGAGAGAGAAGGSAAAAAPAQTSPVAKDAGFWFGKYVGRPNPKAPKDAAHPPKRSIDDSSRFCLGCRMGEAPCERVKTVLKDRYVKVMSARSAPRPASESIAIHKGTLYGETKVMQRTDGREAHTSGYIEILNKGDFAFCVKMFTTESDIYRESSRPSYVSGMQWHEVM
jgi:hypothetical protein